MAFATRLSLAGLALAVIFFALGWAVIPTRVTFGAGSLRCGTSFNPSHGLDAEGDVCAQAGRERLRKTAGIAAVLAVVALSPLALLGWLESHRWLRWLVTSSMVAVWIIAIPFGILIITAAYSAP